MPIKAVIFDFGGVIFRTEDRNPRIALANRFGMDIEAVEHLVFSSPSAKLAEVGSITAKEHWQEVAQTLEVPIDEISSIRGQFFAGDRLDWDLISYIRSLRSKYSTALLSNAFDDLRAELSGDWQVPDTFDQIIISAEEKVAKPDPRIFQIVADRLSIHIDECVFIDDFPRNIEGARRAGMKAIRFSCREQAQHDLEAILRLGNSE